MSKTATPLSPEERKFIETHLTRSASNGAQGEAVSKQYLTYLANVKNLNETIRQAIAASEKRSDGKTPPLSEASESVISLRSALSEAEGLWIDKKFEAANSLLDNSIKTAASLLAEAQTPVASSPQEAPAPTLGKIRTQFAELVEPYKLAEGRKAPEFPEMKKLFERAESQIENKEYGDAQKTLVQLKRLLNESEQKSLGPGKTPSSTEDGKAVPKSETKTAPVTPPSPEKELTAKLRRLQSDLTLLQAPGCPTANETKSILSEINLLSRKKNFAAALDVLKRLDPLIIEARKFAVATREKARIETASKDLEVASSYVEKAGRLDTKGALEARRKLLALRNSKNERTKSGGVKPSGKNVLGLLQEAPKSGEEAGRRLNIFHDRLSQSGVTMAEYAMAGRVTPQQLQEQISRGENAIKDLQERIQDAKSKNNEEAALVLTSYLEEEQDSLKKLKDLQGKSKRGAPKPLKILSKEEARKQSKQRFTELLSGKDGGKWKEHRAGEIGRTVAAQEKKIHELEEKLRSLPESDPQREELSTEISLAKKDLESIKKDQSEIQATLETWPAALNDFKKSGGRWGKTKKAARGGGTPEEAQKAGRAMKAARWMRQELMDDALENTAVRFLEKSARDMGIDSKDIEIVELPPSDDPQSNPQYLDGRARRCQLKIKDPEKQKLYGETLTVFCFAPGSTEDTSDIDMQFIVEENPTAATELIKTFQEVTQERLSDLKDFVGEGSLAEIFDVNPYPAGFVFRDELGSDLHFSDTYTERSMEAKKTVDAGLALIRRLETPPTDEKGEPVDPIEEILKATAGDPLAEDSQLRSLRTGVDVSLKSQYDRAAALLKQFTEPPEGAKDEFNELKKLVDEAADMNQRASWDPDKSWAGPTLSKKELQQRRNQSQKIAAAIDKFAKALDKQSDGQGKAAVAKARNEVYLKCQEEVERLTQARDLAMVEGVEEIQKLEAEISRIGATRELNPELFKKYDEALEKTRSATSAIGTAAFLAQGMALHNADEAFFNRGAIGHVVEAQMGRDFLKTTGSAISSLEANAGFILEHFAHDHVGDSGQELASFAMAVGKYIERMAIAFESIDSRVVDTKGPHGWIKTLGASMSLLKKGKDPATERLLTDPKAQMNGKILEALKKAGIGSLKELQRKLEQVVADAWKAYHAAQ